MLYRIQTLYLLLSILFYSTSLYSLYLVNNKIPVFFISIEIIKNFIITCIILSIISIVLFKKRKIQIIINDINIFFNTINFIIILFFLESNAYNVFFFNKKNIIFIFSLFFCDFILYLSNQYIKKDIKIIDSINRIR